MPTMNSMGTACPPARPARNRGRLAAVTAAVAVGALLLATAARTATGAPPGTARDLAQAFFGSSLIRAEVVSVIGHNVHDFRIDQGRVTAFRPGSLDLLEKDGTQQTVPIGPATQGVAILPRIPRGLRVVTVRDGDGAASQISLAGVARALGKTMLGGTLARAEIVTYEGKTVHDFRIDEGRVSAVRIGTVTVSERDGTQQAIAVAPSTQVTILGVNADLAAVTKGASVITIREGDAPAQEIRILTLGSARIGVRR